jgi:hypothetical protein
MDLSADSLPDDPETLRAMLLAERDRIAAVHAAITPPMPKVAPSGLGPPEA